MSFWTVLKRVGSFALQGEQVAEPFIKTLLPASAPVFALLDPIFAKVVTNVVTVEANNPLDGQGKLKGDAVIADFEAGLLTTQSVLALSKQKLIYDDVALQAAVKSFADGYNSLATVKQSFKVVAI